MAGSSLLALIDDIASLLDDVSVMTKVATQKTAAVLGDDLALNAKQVAGINADRELPVVWAVAKGSFLNKAILVPAALTLSVLAPKAVIPLMMLGGAFLCFEGVEKLVHKYLHSKAEDHAHFIELVQAVADDAVDMVAFEKDRIQGAIRTDFILSAEIIVITLGTVAAQPFSVKVGVLIGIAIIMTIGVYGFVAGIVKLDDVGLFLSQHAGNGFYVRSKRFLGRGLLLGTPYLMKGLSVAGTAAMFLVGGGIITHNLPFLHHAITDIWPGHGLGSTAVSMLGDGVFGIIIGLIALGVVMAFGRLRKLRRRPA